MSTYLMWFLAACLRGGGPEPAVERPPAILPASVAPLYASGSSTPRDPLVRAAVGDHAWDEALSGAAGSLALDSGEDPDLGMARWAAVRAGYPYPVRMVITLRAAPDEVPIEAVAEIIGTIRPGEHLGLARASMGDRDRWVALVGSPALDLTTFPREHPVGGTLSVRADRTGSWSLVSPRGEMWTGDLPLEQRLDSMGEWWLEIRSSGRLTASVPLFVGVESPQFAPLDTPGELVKGPGEAVELGLEVINEIRDQFELDALEFDRTLATLAKQPVVDLATGSWNGAEVQQALVDAGFVQGPVGSIACQAQTVVLCMDHLLRDPASRASWLTPSHGVVGGAAQVGSAGVHMVWNLASE